MILNLGISPKLRAMYPLKKIIICIFCALFLTNMYGQESITSLTVDQCLQMANEKQQSGDVREATRFLNMAAEKCWDAKNYSKAIEYYNNSIELNQVISNWNGIAGINSNLGLIYFDLGQYETSYGYFQKTYTYRKEHNEKVAAISALINISVVLNKIERYNESIKALEEAVSMSRDINDLEQMRSCYGMLSETYTKAGNTAKAADYFHLYKTVHEALLKESEQRYKTEISEATMKTQLAEAERELAETKQRYADLELAEKEKELEGLDAANRALLQSKTKAELMVENLKITKEISELQKREVETQLENEQMKSRNLIIGLCAAFMIVVVIAYFLWQKKKDNQKLAQKNHLINQQKSDLEAALSEIQQKNKDLIIVNDKLNRTQKELDEYQEQLEQIVVTRTSQLRKALEQAQESDRLKSAFFANMSHEIRTPLNAILGFIRFIDDPEMDFMNREKMYNIIQVNAGQLMKMVDDIVTLSEIDSELVTIQPYDCNINDLLKMIMEDANDMIRYSDKVKLEVLVENRLPKTMKYVPVDGKRIQQVLSHLVDNAIKFTDYGFIRLGCEVNQQQKKLSFWIEDSGIGMDAKTLESIFKRFWKHGDTFTQKYRGLGIGLALCKELAELMKGEISVESKKDIGSVFRFTVGY